MIFIASIIIVSSFLISFGVVAMVLRMAHKKSWYDQIDDRKIHTGDVPRLGGIGIALAFIIISFAIAFLIPVLPAALSHGKPLGQPFLFPLIAMILISCSGVFDDFRPMAPRYKLIIQIIAGILVLIPGYTFNRIFQFDFGALGSLNGIRYLITLVWIVGVTNAVNFIDGVDGLAGGVSALAALSYALVFAYFSSNSSIILLCLCLAAALGGFLVFNMPFPRAKIFMGDGGSQLLGFTLAILPLIDNENAASSLSLSHAAALLSIPIFDTASAIWRRIRDRRRIDSPDRMHIHHKLMNLGFRARGVDGILYGLQIVLGFLVFASIRLKGSSSLALLGAAYIVPLGFFIAIHYCNRWAVQKQREGIRVKTSTPPMQS